MSVPVIDPEAIESLRSLNPGDNDEFLREIIGIFLEDTPARIAELHQSLASGDAVRFSRAAHSIKGSSSNLGANRLREASEHLEHASKKTGISALAGNLADIEREFSSAKNELQKYLG